MSLRSALGLGLGEEHYTWGLEVLNVRDLATVLACLGAGFASHASAAFVFAFAFDFAFAFLLLRFRAPMSVKEFKPQSGGMSIQPLQLGACGLQTSVLRSLEQVSAAAITSINSSFRAYCPCARRFTGVTSPLIVAGWCRPRSTLFSGSSPHPLFAHHSVRACNAKATACTLDTSSQLTTQAHPKISTSIDLKPAHTSDLQP